MRGLGSVRGGGTAKFPRETEDQRRTQHQVRNQTGESLLGGVEQKLATEPRPGYGCQGHDGLEPPPVF